MKPKKDRRELGSAALMMLIGIGSAAGGTNYSVGSLARMGPGFFPVMLGLGLILISVMMMATPSSATSAHPGTPAPQPEYRAWFFVFSSVLAFMALGKYGGLVPATFALVFLSALGDRGNTLLSATALAAGMTVLAILVFSMGLRMQFPLFTWG